MPETQPLERDAKAWDGHFVSQQEAQYTTLSSDPGQACANCRWFSAAYDRCFIVENYPQPILATGHSNRWEATPQAVVLDAEPIPVVIVEPIFEYDDSQEMALNVRKSLYERVKAFADNLRSKAATENQFAFNVLDEQPAFKVFKAANGRNAWIARHTGKWVDREKEILADKAHDRYVNHVLKGEFPLPELWMWHAKGTRHGQAVAVWKSGGFVLAAGYFDDNERGQKAFEYYQRNAGKIKLSHMFHYPHESKIDGVYYDYQTIEITTLPDGAEAFPYTSFNEVQTMALSPQAETMIQEALGADALAEARAADNKAATDSKTLDGQGVASKGADAYDDAQAAEKAALETRLKTMEDALKGVPDLLAAVTAMSESIKLLTEKLNAAETARAAELAKVNDLEAKLLEYGELAPPASQSDDTILNQREKTLVDSMIATAQKGSEQSLVEKLMGAQPTIHS